MNNSANFRIHVLDQFAAFCRDNPSNLKLKKELLHKRALHRMAVRLEKEIQILDRTIQDLENDADELF